MNPRLAAPAGAPIADVDPRVTARLRGILLEQDIPVAEHAAFGRPDTLDRARQAYRQRRQPLGELQELALFDFEAKGNDRHFRYRVRFANDFADALLTLSPRGIERLTLRPVSNWQATVF